MYIKSPVIIGSVIECFLYARQHSKLFSFPISFKLDKAQHGVNTHLDFLSRKQARGSLEKVAFLHNLTWPLRRVLCLSDLCSSDFSR